MTLLRRRKIVEAISETSENPPKTTNHIRSSFPSTSPTEYPLDLNLQSLKITEGSKIIERSHKIDSEMQIIDSDTETPQAKRRCFRPDMTSNKILSMTCPPEVIKNEVVTLEVGKRRDDRIPYEVEMFLNDALGDEFNTTVTTLDADQEKNSESGRVQPFFRRMSRIWNNRRNYSISEEIPKGERNGTLNRSVSIARSLSQRIKKVR